MRTCTSCGRESPLESRFCAACGTEFDRAPTHEVRKIVTVVFADVTGSTALGERLDPESLRRVMARYFETASACLVRHGGAVEKFIGDAVMAVFGVPIVHEDDALRAVRAASELRDALPALNAELERDYGVSLQIRVGVNTGEVVVGTAERLATGDAVNVAARLEQAAAPDEILLGDETLALSRGAVDVEPAGPLSLKGKSEPIAAHRLLHVRAGAPAYERRLDAPLVGRRDELARVRGAFARAVDDRRCGLVTVLGPPGIGKSRLAREVADGLGDAAIVLTGRCLPYGEGISYWPLREIFASVGAEADLDAALAAESPEDVAFAVRKALEVRARVQPLALVIEDIHWAEPTLLDLIEHLVDWTRDAPLCLLCLARPELIDARPAWGGGRAKSEMFTLEPLIDADADQMIESLLGGGEVRLDDAALARVRAVAEGNPLFVEQLVATLSEGATERIPSTIQALLSARLETLSDDERELLERAAVIGLDFEWEALARLAPEGQRPSGSLLAALVRKELIRPHELIEDTFRFRHMLVRDAAYERISKDVRAELHTRFADWLDGRGEEFDEIVGYHLEQAYRYRAELGPVTDAARALAERAAGPLAAAGLRAFDRGDTAAAPNLLLRAVSLRAPDDPRRVRLLPVLGRALRAAGRLDQADAVLAEAIERAQSAGDALVVADATVALSDLRFHLKILPRHEVVDAVETAIGTFRRLGDDAGLARALILRGALAFWIGRAAEALDDFRDAARLAAGAGDRATEVDSLLRVLGALRNGPMPIVEALARLDDLESRAVGNRQLELGILNERAYFEAMNMRFDAAWRLVARVRAALEEQRGATLADAWIVQTVSYIALLAGDPAVAEPDLRAMCELAERIGELGYLSSLAPPLVDLLLAQDRVAEALEITERWAADRLTVPEDADAHIGWRRVRAKALARTGDLVAAERLARDAVALASKGDDIDLAGRALADLGEVLRLAGRAEESAAAAREALHRFDQRGNLALAAAVRRSMAEPPQPA